MDGRPNLDFQRLDRKLEHNDRALESKSVAALQRAVVWLMRAHHEVKIVEGLWCLTISQRAAAAWCRQHAPPASGRTCDHTSIYRAVQVWVDRGVMLVRGDTWWLNPDRLKKWFESLLGGEDDLPIFSPVVPSGADRCQVVQGGADRCKVVPSGAEWCVAHSFMIDDEDSFSLSENKNQNHHSLDQSNESCTSRHHPAPEVTAAIAALPELPIGVWDKTRSDSALHSLIQVWWSENALAEKFGPVALEASQMLMGLIVLARTKNNPDGYFFKSRQHPKDYLRRIGQEWFAQIERSRRCVR